MRAFVLTVSTIDAFFTFIHLFNAVAGETAGKRGVSAANAVVTAAFGAWGFWLVSQ